MDEAFLDRFAIIGTAEQCIDRLGRLLEAVKLDRIVVVSGSRGVDLSLLTEVSAVVHEEVLPRVRGLR